MDDEAIDVLIVAGMLGSAITVGRVESVKVSSVSDAGI
jgi:hypothetical protein